MDPLQLRYRQLLHASSVTVQATPGCLSLLYQPALACNLQTELQAFKAAAAGSLKHHHGLMLICELLSAISFGSDTMQAKCSS